MSNYTNLTDLVRKMLYEETTAPAGSSGDFSSVIGPTIAHDGKTDIAYIPGGFASMKKHLSYWGRKKKDWGITVIDEDNHYKVLFEDQFTVHIPKKAYEEFNTKVLDIVNKSSVDLTEMVNERIIEQRSELVHSLYAKLNKVLSIDLRNNKQVWRTINLANYWTTVFKNYTFLDLPEATAINLGKFDRSVVEFSERIKRVHSDDIGEIEMQIAAIRQDRPMNAFRPWSECDNIAGIRIRSIYNKIPLIFEATVGLSLIPTQSIYLEDAEVLEELKSYRTIKVTKDLIWPVGMMFSPSIFTNIKQTIDDLEEKNV